MASQQIRFCTALDGARIAYALVGHGPPLLYVNGWPEHLELEWEQPFARGFLQRLAASSTLVRYDMRGSGLSDRDVGEVDLDVLESDLLTVANQVGTAAVPVISLGMIAGPLALRFAARHPDRVERLVLVGGFLDGSAIMSATRQSGLVEYVRQYGFPHFDFVDGPGVELDDVRGVAHLTRHGSAPELQAQLLELMFDSDLAGMVGAVRCPVLVLHVADDPIVPMEQGRLLAASLPDAVFSAVPGSTAAIWSLADRIVPPIEEFLGRATSRAGSRPGTLTARELEVLACVCDGLANRDIARSLGITEKTVKSHMGSILSKLGARSRAQAAVMAIDAGLVDRRH